MFEAMAVFAFGVAWITAGLEGASTITQNQRLSADVADRASSALGGRA